MMTCLSNACTNPCTLNQPASTNPCTDGRPTWTRLATACKKSVERGYCQGAETRNACKTKTPRGSGSQPETFTIEKRATRFELATFSLEVAKEALARVDENPLFTRQFHHNITPSQTIASCLNASQRMGVIGKFGGRKVVYENLPYARASWVTDKRGLNRI